LLIEKFKKKGVKGSLVSISEKFVIGYKILCLKRDKNDCYKYGLTEDVRVEKIDRKIVDKMSVFLEDRKLKQFYDRILNGNSDGYTVFYKEDIAGYVWYMTGEIYEGISGYREVINENEVYLYDLFIREKYRRKNLSSILISFVEKNSHRKYISTYSVVKNSNYRSMNMFTRLGFKKYKTFITLNLFFKKVVLGA